MVENKRNKEKIAFISEETKVLTMLSEPTTNKPTSRGIVGEVGVEIGVQCTCRFRKGYCGTEMEFVVVALALALSIDDRTVHVCSHCFDHFNLSYTLGLRIEEM